VVFYIVGPQTPGNKKIRTLLVQCARVFIQKLEHQSGKLADWVRDLLCRKGDDKFITTDYLQQCPLSSPVLWQTSWPE